MELFPFGQVEHTLKALSEKQKLTSNNLANAHTPNYQAKDISFAELIGNMNQPFETDLARTMGSQMPEALSTGMPVDMQKELIDMQKTMLFYSMTTRRASTIFNGLRTASQIGR